MKASNVLSMEKAKRSVHSLAIRAKSRLLALARDSRGAGIWEYVLIMAIVAVIAMTVLSQLDPAVRDFLTGIFNKAKSDMGI